MFRNPVPLMLFASLPFVTACSNSDREQAAKSDDGVATFRYQPRDRTKYSQKKEPTQQQASAPATQPASAPSASSPKATGK